MKVNHLQTSSSNPLEVNHLKQASEKASGRNGTITTVDGKGEDRLTISQQARDLHNTDLLLKEELQRLPEVRKDRVEEVHSRMREGFYRSPQATEEVADSLLSQYSKAARKPEESALKTLLNLTDETPEVRNSEVQKAKAHIADGYYNSDKPIQQASENLLTPQVKRK